VFYGASAECCDVWSLASRFLVCRASSFEHAVPACCSLACCIGAQRGGEAREEGKGEAGADLPCLEPEIVGVAHALA